MDERATTKQHISFLLNNPDYRNLILRDIERLKNIASQEISDIFSELNALDYSKDRIQSSPPADAKAFNMELRIQKVEKKLSEELSIRYQAIEEYDDLIGLIEYIPNKNLKEIMLLIYKHRIPKKQVLKRLRISHGLFEGYKEDGIEEITSLAIKYKIFKNR